MNAQKKQLIILAVLGVVLVGAVVYQLFIAKEAAPPGNLGKQAGASAPATPGAKPAPAKPGAGTAPAATPATAPGEQGTQLKRADVDIDALLAGIKEVDFDYDRDRMPRDPMRPLVGQVSKMDQGGEGGGEAVPPATVGQVMGKVVSGIVWDKARPVAVVDNEIVYPGFQYPDGTVVDAIERDRVVFKVGDSLIQVELEEL